MPQLGLGSNLTGGVVLENDTTSFISTWGTAGATEANRTVTLPLISSGSINFTISWGDGSSDTITAFNDAERAHIYTAEGTYTVSVWMMMPIIKQN